MCHIHGKVNSKMREGHTSLMKRERRPEDFIDVFKARKQILKKKH